MKFEGSVALLGDEREPPYERPPLSKEYIADGKSFERILIRPENFWSERNVDLLLGKRVTLVDPVAHKVPLADDSEIGYGKLLWAAGGTARMLSCPGRDAEHVLDVRRRDDADTIMKILPDVEHVEVVGGC